MSPRWKVLELHGDMHPVAPSLEATEAARALAFAGGVERGDGLRVDGDAARPLGRRGACRRVDVLLRLGPLATPRAVESQDGGQERQATGQVGSSWGSRCATSDGLTLNTASESR